MNFNLPVIILDEDFGSDNASGTGIRMLADALRGAGMDVASYTAYGPHSGFAQMESRASCFILSVDDHNFDRDEAQETEVLAQIDRFVHEIRKRNAKVPVYIYGEANSFHHVPNSLLRNINGFIHINEETPAFIARHIVKSARAYQDGLLPPFFSALVNYARNGSYSWHCPGHSGGVAFLKSPVGRLFHEFFGENMLRADVSNSVGELGQLLDHSGPVAQSERNAARIFDCDHLFFVTNGTSTANKTVWHANVAPGDIVVVDRNCHKSILHAITMTRAIPVFLTPTRNSYGIMGPIAPSELTAESIARRIAAHPFASRARRKTPKLFALTQCTYDGVMYNAEQIKQRLGAQFGVLHFDEAWIPHANFHPLYRDMHAIGADRERSSNAVVYATQSTHKMLAGLSQASQILVENSKTRELDVARFNEAFLMHVSTSPQYAIIASCDIAAAMMDGKGGPALIEESIRESLEFRHAMQKAADEFASDWWFKVWGPRIDDPARIEREDWLLGDRDWHGFGPMAASANMLDPIKTTIINPGINLDGDFDATGIPAVVVTRYLREHGVIVEKTGLYSFFIIFNIGITKSRWNSLVTALLQFKNDHDSNATLESALPQFARENPRHAQTGLRDLCQAIHASYVAGDVARLTTAAYTSEMVPVLPPSDASAAIADEAVERVNIDRLEGRISAVLLTPYPPGIPLLIPGERFNREICDYLKFTRRFNNQHPGFESDIHGLVVERRADGSLDYFIDCIDENHA